MLEAQYNGQSHSLAIASFHSPQHPNSWPTTLWGLTEREPGQGLLHHFANREANSEVEQLVWVPWVVNGRAGVRTQVCPSPNPMLFLYMVWYICSSLLIQDSKQGSAMESNVTWKWSFLFVLVPKAALKTVWYIVVSVHSLKLKL